MNKIYKVGVLGCANIAVRSLLPAFKASSRFELVGIASRDKAKAESVSRIYQCSAYGSYDSLIDNAEIDIVYIPLPTGLHYEWVYKALQNGKHVMSEKSLACSCKEVEELTGLARDMKLLLFETFQFRFHSQHAFVKNMIDKGEIGVIRCFRSSFGFPPFLNKDNIRYSEALGGGALLDAGAYTLKAMQLMLPECAFAVRSASLYRSRGSEVDIHGGAYLDSPQGIVAELAFGFDNYYQCGYELWGSLGKVSTIRAFTAPADMQVVVIVEKQGRREEILLPADDHFANMLMHISRCLDENDYEDEYIQNINQSHYINDIKDYCYGR